VAQVESFSLGPFATQWLKGYRLTGRDIVVELLDYGATVTKIVVPDRSGAPGDVLLGCPTIAAYLDDHPHFNCIAGRYANRMTNARFELDGTVYELTANVPPHHLHGGANGLHRKLWSSEIVDDGVRLWTRSAHLEEGYPGNLEIEAIYRVDDGCLSLELRAQTDRATPVSLTSHHYYNLAGSDPLTGEPPPITICRSRAS
jgi:aldose 1-epimerase